jgi:O-antigen/teichoic acid export membrane protein
VTESDFASSRLTLRLAANSLVQAIGGGLGALISFFTFVAVTRGLGPEAFGDLTAALVFLYLPVVLAELGFTTTVVREISREPERTEAAMRASIPLRALVSAAVIGAAVGLGMAMPFSDRTKVAILISSIGAFLTLMTVSVVPVLQAQLKMHWAVAGNLAGRLATLVLTLAALGVGLGFKSIVAAQVIGLAVTFLFYLLIVVRLVPLRPIVDPAYWRTLLTTSVVLGFAVALAQIYFRIDTLLIALLRDSVEVGLYAAAYKFIELSEFVSAAVGASVLPPLARFVAVGDPRAQRLVQRAFDVVVAAAAPLAVGMLVFAPEIIRLTAGSEFGEASDALRLLAPYVLFSFVAGLFWRTLLATGRDRRLLSIALSVLSFNVTLNLIFVPLYGFEAAAAVAVVSEICALVPVALAVRSEGLLPGVGYVPVVAAAAGSMGIAAVMVPGPEPVAALIAGLLYVTVLLALPGTAKEIVFGDLRAALRRAS